MLLTGKQKAAMLLMTLDVTTASELLRGVDPNVVQELAVEVAYLDAKGMRSSRESVECVKEFCVSLEQKPAFEVKNFLGAMLKSTVGDQQANQIQGQIDGLLQKRDPFISIRAAEPQLLASILNNEHPQAVAVILSELPTSKSAEVLGLLGEGVRISAARRMPNTANINPDAKFKIAQLISKQLASANSEAGGGVEKSTPEKSLRKIAVMLRSLSMDMRSGMLSAIEEKDEEAAKKVGELMVLWEDIPAIAERSLQEALRSIDVSKLAMGLVDADENISEKIKGNISERAAATIEEEMSLMRDPKKEEIAEARGEIVEVFRQLNEKGELEFLEA